MSSFSDLVKKSRSIRRFDATRSISRDTLLSLIDTARFAPTGANKQPLRFFPITDRDACDKLFPLLHWAMALPDWKGPTTDERPTAYIIILADTEIVPEQRIAMDVGIAAQTIALAAAEMDLGCCMLGAFKKDDVTSCLKLPEALVPELVIAIGAKGETVHLVEPRKGNDLRYYRDEQDAHCVPKRPLSELVFEQDIL
ncbi:MAG: nitroreductase family protein [Clostridia bacterium]|nr:nitroreductase family protein [Clostridia bacterium]